MKTRSFLWTMALFLYGGMADGQSTVTLTGHIRNSGSIVAVEDFSEFQHLKRADPDRVLMPDSSGAFSVTFRLDAPNYFRIGRNVLYLSPGDRLTCELDAKLQLKSTFSGQGSDADNYLTGVPFPKAGSYIDAGYYIKQSPVATMDSILMLARKRRQQLEGLTGITPEFRRLEEARIRYDIINSIHALATYINFMNRMNNEDYIRTFKAIADPVAAYYGKDIVDASMLKLEVYRDIIGDLVASAPAGPDKQKIKDWQKVSDLVKRMDTTGDRKILGAYERQLAGISCTAYRQAGESYLESLTHFRKGDYAIDVTCYDTKGKRVTLSSLRGKVIYVDLWATWCGPCMAEMPSLEALKEKFKDNPDVAFVSVSIDDEANIRGWLKNVEDRKAGGYQWQVNRNQLNAYNITGIPRTILIGKDFRVDDLNAPLPSSRELPGRISKLLTQS